MGTVVHLTDQSIQLSANNWNQAYNVATIVQANSASWEGGGGDPAVNTVVYMNSATWINTSTVVQSNSANWNTAYNTATVFQANSASYATDTTVRSVSSLLTLLTLTNTLTSQLLPISIYQSTSGSFATSSFVDGKFLPLSGGTITGNLSVLGDVTYLDTAVSVVSTMFIDTNSTETALRVTQRGTGDVIRVEDSANPDSTPFIVKSDGLVGIGTANPNTNLTVVGSLSVNSGVITTNSHLNVFQHWNNTATEFNGLNVTINPSAYNVNSTPFRLTTTDTGNPFFGVQSVIGAPFQQVVRVFGDQRGLVFGPRQTGAGTGADFFSLRWQTGQVQLLNTATFGWADFPFSGNETLTIARDANDTLAQRRGTNPQAVRIYNTYTAGTPISSEYGFLQWSGNTFQIGTSATGSGSVRQIEFLRDGLRAAFIDSAFFFNADSGFLTPGQIRLGAAQALYWNGRAIFRSPAVDQITLLNSTETGFNRLNFGGTTAAFPALKNSLSGIQVRRADDTDFAPLSASVITATSDIEIANAVSGIIFRSPDGNRWRVTMTNSGTLSSVLL